MNALEWAEALYRQHVACTSGHDRGPVVDAIEHYAEIPLGSPWCAAFVWYCFHKAAVDSQTSGKPFPGSAGSQALKARFENLGLLSRDPQDLLSWKGALGGWTDADDPSHGHVFFISGRLTDPDGKVVAVQTVEGNSDSAPHNAVNCLKRIVPVTAEGHEVWFLNTSEFVGGGWW